MDGSETSSSCPFVSLASNQFTISSGEYLIRARAPAFRVNTTLLFLRDTGAGTNDVYRGLQNGDWTGSGGNYAQVWPQISGRISLAASKTFELKQYTSGAQTDSGLGQQSGVSGFSSKFAWIEITKLK